MLVHIWEDETQKKCKCGIVTFTRLHQYGKNIVLCNTCLNEIKNAIKIWQFRQ